MRRHALLVSLVFAFAVPTFSVVARADDAAVAEAQARFKEGLDLADANHHEEARLKFQQAAAVLKAPAVLYNLARSEQLTGHDYDAVEHFKQFLRSSGNDPKITDAMRDKAKQNIVELSRKVGQIDIDAPPNSRVSIDGKALEEAPKEPVAVPPGKHIIEATFEGRVKSVSVECGAGNTVVAKIVFDSASTEPPREEPKGFWTTGRYVGAGIGIGGLVALGVGVGFQLSATSKSNEAAALRGDSVLGNSPSACNGTSPPAECGTLQTLKSDYNTASVLRTVFLVSGGALVAGGAVLMIVSSPKESEPTRGMHLVPFATAHETGVACLGSF